VAHVFNAGGHRDINTWPCGPFYYDKFDPAWISKIFVQALGIALSNPKAIVFLTALFPQFINTKEALIPQFSMLIAILMFFSFSFLMGYALLAHKAKIWITKPERIKTFNRTSGSIFIGFGLLLATSSNK